MGIASPIGYLGIGLVPITNPMVSSTPVETFHILTESGNTITTESGNKLTQEGH